MSNHKSPNAKIKRNRAKLFRFKFLQWFRPQPAKFRRALHFTNKKELSPIKKWIKKNLVTIYKIELVAIVLFILFSIWYDLALLLVIPAVGAIIALRKEFYFAWWYLKVNVLRRKFYQDRRELYSQGTLFHHLEKKESKNYNTKYGKVIIWDNTRSRLNKNVRFNHLQSTKKLTSKEYIKI